VDKAAIGEDVVVWVATGDGEVEAVVVGKADALEVVVPEGALGEARVVAWDAVVAGVEVLVVVEVVARAVEMAGCREEEAEVMRAVAGRAVEQVGGRAVAAEAAAVREVEEGCLAAAEMEDQEAWVASVVAASTGKAHEIPEERQWGRTEDSSASVVG
jgi:hypothetical protein